MIKHIVMFKLAGFDSAEAKMKQLVDNFERGAAGRAVRLVVARRRQVVPGCIGFNDVVTVSASVIVHLRDTGEWENFLRFNVAVIRPRRPTTLAELVDLDTDRVPARNNLFRQARHTGDITLLITSS